MKLKEHHERPNPTTCLDFGRSRNPRMTPGVIAFLICVAHDQHHRRTGLSLHTKSHAEWLKDYHEGAVVCAKDFAAELISADKDLAESGTRPDNRLTALAPLFGDNDAHSCPTIHDRELVRPAAPPDIRSSLCGLAHRSQSTKRK